MVFSLMVGPIVGGWLVWSNGLGLWLWLYGWLSNGWFFILRFILRVFCCFQLDGWAWTPPQSTQPATSSHCVDQEKFISRHTLLIINRIGDYTGSDAGGRRGYVCPLMRTQ